MGGSPKKKNIIHFRLGLSLRKSHPRWDTPIAGNTRMSRQGIQGTCGHFHLERLGEASTLLSGKLTKHNYMLVGGWATPLKNSSQVGWLFPIYGKIKNGNQTTNQTTIWEITLLFMGKSTLVHGQELDHFTRGYQFPWFSNELPWSSDMMIVDVSINKKSQQRLLTVGLIANHDKTKINGFRENWMEGYGF